MVNNQIEFDNKFSKEEKEIKLKREDFQGKLVIEDYLNLEKLYLRDIKSIDKITLKNLPQLQECTIWDCNLQDLVIENCPQMKKLNARKNLLTSLEFLKSLENLEELEIDGNTEITLELEHLPKGLKNFSLIKLVEKNSLKYKDLKRFIKEIMLSLSPKAKDELVIELRKRTQRKDSISAPGNTKELMLYAKEAIESAKELKKELEIELAKSETKIQELEEKQVLFEEQETKINYLELRVQELTNLIKTQKQKIIQDFLNVLPEKELVQQLITTYLEFKKAEKQGSLSRKLKKECNKIEDRLEEKLGEDFVDKLQPILSDCEKLVDWELELEERLKGKTFLIEEQKHTLKQITYGKEDKAKLVKIHETIWQEEQEQLQEEIFANNYLRNQLSKVEELTQQTQILQTTNFPQNNK